MTDLFIVKFKKKKTKRNIYWLVTFVYRYPHQLVDSKLISHVEPFLWCHIYKIRTSAKCLAHFPSCQLYRPSSRSMWQRHDLLLNSFCRHPQEQLVPLLPLRGANYCTKHFFPSKELFNVRNIYFLMRRSLVWLIPFMIHEEVPLGYAWRGRAILTAYSTRRMHIPLSMSR